MPVSRYARIKRIGRFALSRPWGELHYPDISARARLSVGFGGWGVTCLDNLMVGGSGDVKCCDFCCHSFRCFARGQIAAY